MSMTLSLAQAKELVLARLRQTMNEMPASERTRPRYIIDFKPYSILDLIAIVQRESPEGRSYVFDQAKQMGYAVSD